jgi:acetyltransferase
MSPRTHAPSWPRAERSSDGISYRVRPLRADDAARERAFILALSPESRFQRFMHGMREPSDALVAQLVDIDSHARMALAAVIGAPSDERIVGVARYAADPGGRACEFGVAVADDWQCRGIGTTLARLLFDHAAREGFETIYGNVLANNQRMLELATWLGLTVEPSGPGQATVRVARPLRRVQCAGAGAGGDVSHSMRDR